MIKIENIYYMLAYAFRNLNEDEFKLLADEEFNNPTDLLAAILAKGMSTQIRKGIAREYISINDELRSPKGKINISTSVSKRTQLKRQLNCDFDEYSENIYMNQIIKSTAELLLRSKEVDVLRHKALKKMLVYFSNVDLISIHKIKWNELKYHRHNNGYRLMINICFMIITGIIMKDKNGKIKLMSYIDDQNMSRLYEKFVLEFYKKHYPMIKTSAAYVAWNVDDGYTDFLPLMKSDITLQYEENTLIIDTKYYSKTMQGNQYNETKTMHSNNMYQIFSYVKNKDINNDGSVMGMLLYAKTDENITPNQKFEMSGNTIYVQTLSLDGDFRYIKEQLDDIANIIIK